MGSDDEHPTANDYQVGGDHYKAQAGFEQHWDRQWRLWGPGYFVGNITAYVERYRLKNGLEDLQKARHYLQKLIELEEAARAGGVPPGGGFEPLPSKEVKPDPALQAQSVVMGNGPGRAAVVE